MTDPPPKQTHLFITDAAGASVPTEHGFVARLDTQSLSCGLPDWYFSEPRASLGLPVSECEEAEAAMLREGARYGEQLASDNPGLQDFLESVQSEGEELRVSLFFEDPSAFAIPHELLVAPGGRFLLSASCWGFARRFDAAAIPPTKPGLDDGNLKVLRVVSHAATASSTSRRADAMAWQLRLLEHERVDVDVLVDPDEDALRAYLEDHSPHVVHWDGPFRRDSGESQLGLSGESGIVWTAGIFELLSGVAAVILDCAGRALPPELARTVLDAGADNVVGLGARLDAVGAGLVWDGLYEQLLRGRSVWTAVSEARKELQRQFLESCSGSRGRPAATTQLWPALVHYARGDVSLFEEEQPRVPWHQSARQTQLRRSLAGFNPSLLWGTPAVGGEREAYRALLSLRAGNIPVLVAPRGHGMSTALHQLGAYAVANGHVGTALYWDFGRETFTLEETIQMAANELGVEDAASASVDCVVEKLAAERRLLIWDRLNWDEVEPGVLDFAQRVHAAGAWVALGSNAQPPGAEGGSAAWWNLLEAITLRGLNASERVAHAQRSVTCTSANAAAASQLLHRVEPSPFLIGQVFKLARLEDLEELSQNEALGGLKRADDPVRAFFQWRWASLDPHLQRLLAACSGYRGPFVEILMVAIDRRDQARTECGEALWHCLDMPPQLRFGEAIAAWDRAGFLQTHDMGRVLDPRAFEFLAQRAADAFDPGVRSALDEALSRVVCEAFALVQERASRSGDEGLKQHLLAHRSTWATHAEALWGGELRSLSFRTVLGLQTLLGGARLGDEFGRWALSLLEREDSRALLDATGADAAIWLTLARQALEHGASPQAEVLASGAQTWLARFEDPTWRASKDAQALPVLPFLQSVLGLSEDYARLASVQQVVCEQLRESGSGPALLAQLRVLAGCQRKAGDDEEARTTETELVERATAGSEPDEMGARAVLQVASNRLENGDAAGCKELLEWLLALPDELEERLAHELALLRGDLEVHEGNLEHAGASYCAAWSSALRGRSEGNVVHAGSKLLSLKEALGEESFARLYLAQAGDAPRPEALGLAVSGAATSP